MNYENHFVKETTKKSQLEKMFECKHIRLVTTQTTTRYRNFDIEIIIIIITFRLIELSDLKLVYTYIAISDTLDSLITVERLNSTMKINKSNSS